MKILVRSLLFKVISVLFLFTNNLHGLLPMYVFDIGYGPGVKELFAASVPNEVTLKYCSMHFPVSRFSGNSQQGLAWARVNFILKAIEENWGDFFVYCESGIQFFQPFIPLLKECRPMGVYRPGGGPLDYDLLCLHSICHNSVSTGFMMISANQVSRQFWTEIAHQIQLNNNISLDAVVHEILSKKSTIKVFWDFLPLSFYVTHDEAVEHVPANLVMHYAAGAVNEQDFASRAHRLNHIINEKNEIYTKALSDNLYDQEKFILLTMLYNERNSERMKEYFTCLENNLKHPLIGHVHVIYDTSKDGDDAMPQVRDFLSKSSVGVTYVDTRQSYNALFKLAHEKYPGAKIIISNADIYFDKTLCFLRGYDLSNKFIALSRWDHHKGTISLRNQRKCQWSQDAWIYQDPLPYFEANDILLGTMRCDRKIAYRAHQAGLVVENPALTVSAIHLHESGVRNYSRDVVKDHQIYDIMPHFLGLH